MSKSRPATDVLIVSIYLGVVGLVFYFNSVFILGTLTIPWSIPLMMLSGLIVHITVGGAKIIMLGFVVGAVLNSVLFLYSRNRSQFPRR